MKRFSKVSNVCLFIIIACQVNAQTKVQPNPTRPSAADNAYLTAYGYSELEIGWAKSENAWTIPTLIKISPISRLELGFTFSGLLNHFDHNGSGETEFGDPGLQLKGQVSRKEWGALAVVGRVERLSDKNMKYTFYTAASFPTKVFAFDITLGASFLDTKYYGFEETFQYAFAFAPNLNHPLGTYVEIFGESSSNSKPLFFDAGLAYPLLSSFVVDAAIFIGLNEDADDWQIQVGFTTLLAKIFD